jgi:hypothetical protein
MICNSATLYLAISYFEIWNRPYDPPSPRLFFDYFYVSMQGNLLVYFTMSAFKYGKIPWAISVVVVTIKKFNYLIEKAMY